MIYYCAILRKSRGVGRDMHYPEPIVGALIINSHRKILLVKQKKWNGAYCIPGGHIELNESIEEAIKREVLEEVGLLIRVIQLLGVQDGIHPLGFHKKKHFIFLDYLCETIETNVKIDNREIQRFFWADPKKAMKYNIVESSKKTIKNFLSVS